MRKETNSFRILNTCSLEIELGRNVDLLADVFAVLFPLAHTFGQKILDLAVDGAEIVLCPGGDGGVELGGQAHRLPELTTGWASWFPHSTTSRFETMAALRSSSSSTVPFSARRSSAISTMPTAPSTIILRASMMALACWRWSMTAAISGA